MEIFTFGEYNKEGTFKVLNERAARASAGIMLLLASIAAINGFILEKYIIVTYISGFLMLNFIIGVFINPRFSPTIAIGTLITYRQSALPTGAAQKRFAWTLGLLLSAAIFLISFFLLNDPSYFEPVCMLCMLCILLLYMETAFGICVGCKIYDILIRFKIIKRPEVAPNCPGGSC